MPLIKSKSDKAIGKNIEMEEKAGKPHKQALAIALNVQRAAKKKKMASGGMIPMDDDMSDMESLSVAERIRRKKMADGGMVDIQENGEEEGSSPYDDMNADAVKKELYDDDQISDQPMDSNEMGDDLDADEHDHIAKMRAHMKRKRGM